MTQKYLMLDVDDPRANAIADVLANKTCKKILGLLAERELSESELASALHVPLNTINYNVKKLASAGLIESSRSLWSSKGRAVKVYRVSGKKIVISPKTMIRGLVPALAALIVATFGLRIFGTQKEQALKAALDSGADGVASSTGLYDVLVNVPNTWAWFFVGGLFVLLVVLLWQWYSN